MSESKSGTGTFETRADRVIQTVRESDRDLCIRFESTPEPMYATLEDDGSFQLWSHDYTKQCQTRVASEDMYRGYETAEAAILAIAYDSIPATTCLREEIDTEPKPVGTTLSDF